MMERTRERAADAGLENVEFGEGRVRDPQYDGDVDIVVSNFAMHHLSDEEKREAIRVIADLAPRTFVLGDVMFFGEPDPDEPFYSPEVDRPRHRRNAPRGVHGGGLRRHPRTTRPRPGGGARRTPRRRYRVGSRGPRPGIEASERDRRVRMSPASLWIDVVSM
jgi:hypothetical protein